MEESKASSHGLRSLLIAPATEIQSHLCLGTCTPWKSTREPAGCEGLGMQEVKYPTSLVYQLVPNRLTVHPDPRQPIPVLWSGTVHHLLQQRNISELPIVQKHGDAQHLFHPLVLLRAPQPQQPKLWLVMGACGPHSGGLGQEHGFSTGGRRAACLPIHLHTPQRGSSRISRPLKGCLFILGGRLRQLHCFAVKLGL